MNRTVERIGAEFCALQKYREFFRISFYLSSYFFFHKSYNDWCYMFVTLFCSYIDWFYVFVAFA